MTTPAISVYLWMLGTFIVHHTILQDTRKSSRQCATLKTCQQDIFHPIHKASTTRPERIVRDATRRYAPCF
jgi:hypothetical protein